MVFSDYIWQDCLYTGRSTEAYTGFYQGVPIYHCTHIPVIVAQYNAESDYNAAFATGMALEKSRKINNDFLNKEPDVVPEQEHLIILDGKSAVCMSKNGKETKHTRHISRRMHSVRSGEEWNIHKTFELRIRLNEFEIFNDFRMTKITLKLFQELFWENIKQCKENHV